MLGPGPRAHTHSFQYITARMTSVVAVKREAVAAAAVVGLVVFFVLFSAGGGGGGGTGSATLPPVAVNRAGNTAGDGVAAEHVAMSRGQRRRFEHKV